MPNHALIADPGAHRGGLDKRNIDALAPQQPTVIRPRKEGVEDFR